MIENQSIAVIDLGTNTFHLLIATLNEQDEFTIREKYKEPVKLGEGGINQQKLSKASMRRGLTALKKFRKLIDAKGAKHIFAFATSAIRSAKNGLDFCHQALEETGIKIEVINGNEEAALIYEGVKNGIQLPLKKETLIVDIGGGSVEFIVSKDNKAQLLRSVDIGAARLLELFSPEDPISSSSLNKIRTYIYDRLEPLLSELKEFDLQLMVGSSGSFETLAAMVAHRKKDFLSMDNLNSYRFTIKDLEVIKGRLYKLTRSQRLKIPGMENNRVDMIVMGMVLIELLLEELAITQLMISNYALKEGILFRFIEERRNRLEQHVGNTQQSLRAKAIRNLGKKYKVNVEHGVKVSELCQSIFRQLKPLHGLGGEALELLRYAALLHDIGYFIARSGHHKHGQYIVMNSNLYGFSNDELLILGNIVRYHRKSPPSKDHLHYKILSQKHSYLVRVLAGILRIADNLDRGHRNHVKTIQARLEEDKIVLEITAKEIIDLELMSAEENKKLLEQVLRKSITIKLIP